MPTVPIHLAASPVPALEDILETDSIAQVMLHRRFLTFRLIRRRGNLSNQ